MLVELNRFAVVEWRVGAPLSVDPWRGRQSRYRRREVAAGDRTHADGGDDAHADGADGRGHAVARVCTTDAGVVSPGRGRIGRSGIRFLIEVTLGPTWPVFALVRPAKRHALPGVLSVAEVHQLLPQVHDLRARMTLTLIYSCGLRLSEGVGLLTRDIDSARMVVHVRTGKGGRDRYVPLPTRTLD